MRNAGLILGIIAGMVGMIVGFFASGYLMFVDWVSSEVDPQQTFFLLPDNPYLWRAAGLIAPVLAIAGGAMAHSQRYLGSALMLVSAVGMAAAFGFGIFTMFPIAMAGLGGLLVLGAPAPDVAR